jgi:hypothetical protein
VLKAMITQALDGLGTIYEEKLGKVWGEADDDQAERFAFLPCGMGNTHTAPITP